MYIRDQVTFGRVTKTGQRKGTSQKRYDPCLLLLSGEGNCFQEELTHLPLLISHGEWMPFLQYCLLHTGVKGLRNLNQYVILTRFNIFITLSSPIRNSLVTTVWFTSKGSIVSLHLSEISLLC